MNSNLLNAALAAAGRGWPVFPLRPGDKRPAGHPERNCPRTGRCTDGHRTPEQRATLAPEQITACWQTAPYNVGIATGPAGLLVVDLDIPKEDDGPAPANGQGRPMAWTSSRCFANTPASGYRPRRSRCAPAVAANTCTSPPPPKSGCVGAQGGWGGRSTREPGAGTWSPPAAPSAPARTRSFTTHPRPPPHVAR